MMLGILQLQEINGNYDGGAAKIIMCSKEEERGGMMAKKDMLAP